MAGTGHRQELLLVWKQPVTRQRYLIGHLIRDGSGYHFQYERDLPRSLDSAMKAGFRLLDSFPTPDGHWNAPEMFPTFRRRLLPAWRMRDMQALGVSPDADMEFFRLTGGRLPTDSLEFLEPIRQGEEGQEYTVRFPVAGWRYYGGESVAHELRRGVSLRLELEPDNPYDSSAIQILSPSGTLIGYVPAIYAWYLDDSVENGTYEAAVDDVGSREEPQQRVVVRFHGVRQPIAVRPLPEGLERYAAVLLT